MSTLRAAVARIDLRDADVRVTGEVRAEAPRVPGLGAVVELLANRAGELVDQADGVDEAQRLDALPGEARCLVEEDEVGLDLSRSSGTLHLDGDLAPVREAQPDAPGRSTPPRSAVSSNSRKSCSTVSPNSASIVCSTSANGNGRTSSCSDRSSKTMSSGTTSGRVDSSCPNFTNVGPSSSSISLQTAAALGTGPCVELLLRQPPGVQAEPSFAKQVAEAVTRGNLGDLGETLPGSRHAAQSTRAALTRRVRPACAPAGAAGARAARPGARAPRPPADSRGRARGRAR